MSEISSKPAESPGTSPAASAVEAFRAGRLREAEALCREALGVDSRDFDALHLLGAVAAETGRLDMAIELLNSALALRPDSADAACNLGEFLRRRGNLDPAIAAFDRALALNPQLPAAHNGLGLARLSQGRTTDAITAFQAGTVIAPQFANAWHNLGLASMMDGRPEEAITAYLRALELTPNRLETLRDLGNVYLATDAFELAAEIFSRALSVRSDFPQAAIGLARAQAELGVPGALDAFRDAVLKAPRDLNAQHAFGKFLMDWGHFAEAAKFFAANTAIPDARVRAFASLAFSRKVTGEDEGMIEQMLSAVFEPTLGEDDRATLSFAIGKALDDRGRYGEAIRHFDEANRLWRSTRPFDRSGHQDLVDRIIADHGPSKLDARKPVASQSDRPILIIGMPRSGTTLVEQILASHPSVAAGGEMQFWTRHFLRSNALPSIVADEAGAVIDGYMGELSRVSRDALRVTDKQPYNFLVLGLVHALFPNARIVHCRRDPIGTALSIYFTRFATAGNEYANERGDIVAYYRTYRRLMEHWRPMIPADRLIDIDYEHLVAEPEASVRELIAFCGLEWNDACLRPEDTVRSVRTASAWQVRQPIYRSSTLRRRNYEPWLGEFAELGLLVP